MHSRTSRWRAVSWAIPADGVTVPALCSKPWDRLGDDRLPGAVIRVLRGGTHDRVSKDIVATVYCSTWHSCTACLSASLAPRPALRGLFTTLVLVTTCVVILLVFPVSFAPFEVYSTLPGARTPTWRPTRCLRRRFLARSSSVGSTRTQFSLCRGEKGKEGDTGGGAMPVAGSLQ